MRAEDSAPPLGAAWGKAISGAVPHPLTCHILDTAAVARVVLPLLIGPAARSDLVGGFSALPDPVGWIALLCGVHDIGKYSPAFQSLRLDLAKRSMGEPAATDLDWLGTARHAVRERTDTPHGVITALHMKVELSGWGANPGVAARIAAVLGGHHGHFIDSAALGLARGAVNDHGGTLWAAWRHKMIWEVTRLLGLASATPEQWRRVEVSMRAAVSLAAVTSVSDWIASDRSMFDYVGSDVDLDRYAATRVEVARRALAQVGWRAWQAPTDTGFAPLFGLVPRPVQRIVAQTTRTLSEPALVIIESPTGEGKTEASLQFATSMVRRLGLAGWIVGMPTQATSNQVHERVERLLHRLGDPTAVGLLHSNADDYRAARAAEEPSGADPSAVSQDDPDDGAARAGEWFTRKRNLLVGLGVGTVDQLMKAAIRSGHVFVRLAGLSNKVVVFDEMHAYDTYMSTILDRLLMWLGWLEVPVVVLSATLPSRRRADLVRAWQKGADAGRSPEPDGADPVAVYPRVTVAERGSAPRVVSVPTSPLNRDRVVHLSRVGEDDAVTWLLGRAAAGRCVAAIHNLVARVTATSSALGERIERLPAKDRPELITITGQLSAAQRHAIEADLMAKFGPNGNRPASAIIVGTQVLEQSLDLDFDGMISDLAPVDALIQRVGRVHRHSRVRRGRLELAITGVVDGEAGLVFPRYTTNIYQPWVLLRTWALLRDRATLTCPNDVPELIDRVYGPNESISCPPGWDTAWLAARKRHDDAVEWDRHQASTMYLPMPASLQGIDELTLRPKDTRRTRLSSGRRR